MAIDVDDFRTLNRCLDDAIACAVTEFGRQRDQSMLDAESAREDERIGFLTHEIRNLLNTAGAAFDILKSGNVGVGGRREPCSNPACRGWATSSIVRSPRSDCGRGFRIGSSSRCQHSLRTLAPAAAMEATARDLQLIVQPGEAGAIVHADRQILSAVVVNLLQNAFKFTHPQNDRGAPRQRKRRPRAPRGRRRVWRPARRECRRVVPGIRAASRGPDGAGSRARV